MGLGARSSSIDSTRSASHRLSKVKANKDGEAAAINYLHNAQGQRVFKGEPRVLNYQPSEARLGAPFTAWLEKNFAWLWDKAQASANSFRPLRMSNVKPQEKSMRVSLYWWVGLLSVCAAPAT